MAETFPGFAPDMPEGEIIQGFEEQFAPEVTPFGANELTWQDSAPMAAKKGTQTGTAHGTKTDTGQDDSGD